MILVIYSNGDIVAGSCGIGFRPDLRSSFKHLRNMLHHFLRNLLQPCFAWYTLRQSWHVRLTNLHIHMRNPPPPTPENAPVGGETVYGLTKVDQEKLVLLWGKQVGIPTVALRYSCTYGPRQSIFNPYTGVIAIFCTRLLNNLPPVLYEDGEQTRDFSFVDDIARANLLAAETGQVDGVAVNVGSGEGTPIRKIAEILSALLKIDIKPEARGDFRPGEMRHLTSDTKLIRSAGYKPQVELEEGIRRYIDWIRTQSDIRDYFSEAEQILRSKGIVHRVEVKNA